VADEWILPRSEERGKTREDGFITCHGASAVPKIAAKIAAVSRRYRTCVSLRPRRAKYAAE